MSALSWFPGFGRRLRWAGAWLAASAGLAAADRPNVLLILADDQAWSGTPVPMIPGNPRSATPGIRMPHLQRLAREGMVFSQAYAGHPKCECSRASLLMGRSNRGKASDAGAFHG